MTTWVVINKAWETLKVICKRLGSRKKARRMRRCHRRFVVERGSGATLVSERDPHREDSGERLNSWKCYDRSLAAIKLEIRSKNQLC